nr:reverse transcriptase domain-containing protein [Tanacetum cinerariifolium]
MSSPNHPTSNLEDAFSSNFSNYILASSDYVPASLEKTYSESLNNSFGLVPIASPTLSLFHDDPYMKVINPYYDKELPIPSPIIMPPSSMLSPMFDPQDFFLPKKILPPRKQAHFLSLSFTDLSALPQAFEIAENYHGAPDTMAPKRTLTSAALAMNQAAIQQLINDRVAAPLEAQAANMANTNNTNRILERRETHAARKCTYKEFMSFQPFYFNSTEGSVSLIHWFERTKSIFYGSNCTEDCKVKFATGTLIEDALSWWNSYAKPIGIKQADKIAWSELKRLLTNNYCP